MVNASAPGRNNGIICITGDEVAGSNNEILEMELCGTFESHDGQNFFIVNKSMGPNNYVPVYKSEIKPAHVGKFIWNKFAILTSVLCKEEDDREIKVEYFRYE